MKTTCSCRKFPKLLHSVCHSTTRQEKQQKSKIFCENRIRMFHLLRQHSKRMFTIAFFFGALCLVIWLVTGMHGYKDGVLLALKVVSNRFELSFEKGRPKFSYVCSSR